MQKLKSSDWAQPRIRVSRSMWRIRPASTFRVILLVTLVSLLPASRVCGDEPISFRYDVLPVLSKLGCSSGACHGSPTGKGKFRLSLRGFDPELDLLTITRESAGRRVDRLSPRGSLLLRKPTMSVPHGGGLRLRRSDPEYEVLARWIENGCNERTLVESDVATNEQVVSIAIQPIERRFVWPNWAGQLAVTARYSTGRKRDITHLAVYTSSDPAVGQVEATGKLVGNVRGETTVVVRYLDWIDTVELAFDRPVEGFQWPDIEPENAIDRIVYGRLKELQIPPSPLCPDHEFVRRVYLTVLGSLPTRAEAESFMADERLDKRAILIDKLLERPEHAQFWGQKWGDLLRVTANQLGTPGAQQIHAWLVSAVAENRPLDQFVHQLLTATGKTSEVPAANLYRAFATESELAEGMSQLLLGIRIQCAKCHNHPSDRWSQDNYYGLSAIFNRVNRVAIEGQDAFDIVVADAGEVTQPRTRKELQPWVPDQGFLTIVAEQDRRAVFANWLGEPDNPIFARVSANRIWSELLGRGIVEPVDDFRADNPPAHPELLDYLATQFGKSGFDQRALIREILNSRVYQHSSETSPLNREDIRYFSHARARLMDAEPLLDAISQVTGSPTQFGLPNVSRATQLPSPEFGTDFLKVFGQPNRNTVCECERSGDPKLAQSLQLINGDVIPRKIRDGNGRLKEHLYDISSRVDAAGTPLPDGLVAWFDANFGVKTNNSATASDGGSVESWTSRVGKLVASQPEVGMRPTYHTGGLQGLPHVEFDGLNDFLHNTELALVASGSARSVIVVGQSNDPVGGALFTFGRERIGGSAVFTCQHVVIGGNYYVYSDGVNAAGNTTVPLTDFTQLHVPFVTSFLSEGSGKKLRVRLNGSDLSTSQAGGVGVDEKAKGFTIGSREDIPVGQQIWNGGIAEVLVYDRALDADSLQAVGAYLATKFDLTSEYPKQQVDVEKDVSNEEVIGDFYWAALSRPPSPEELHIANEYIAGSKTRVRGLEDIVWALLNSKEFLFQH